MRARVRARVRARGGRELATRTEFKAGAALSVLAVLKGNVVERRNAVLVQGFRTGS